MTTEEELLSLSEAAKLFPGRQGKRISVVTIWRWVQYGVVCKQNKERIKLESTTIGGLRMTSRQACERFIAALNPQASEPAAKTQVPNSAKGMAAAKKLQELGA